MGRLLSTRGEKSSDFRGLHPLLLPGLARKVLAREVLRLRPGRQTVLRKPATRLSLSGVSKQQRVARQRADFRGELVLARKWRAGAGSGSVCGWQCFGVFQIHVLKGEPKT